MIEDTDIETDDTTSVSRSDSSVDESPGIDVFSDEEELHQRENNEENDLFGISEPSQKQHKGGFLEKDCGRMTVRALIGLGIAGLGGTLIGDVYGMFYVDCFLRAYKLPMKVFGIGSAIFAFVHTANDVAGAYLLDRYCSGDSSKQHKKREDLVGLSGCLFALSVLGPFFRWGPRSSSNSNNGSNVWDGLHFVGSLSIYDTMFSFNCILQGSIVSDNHSMTENHRITFFALRDMVGILAPLMVTKIGLSLFDVSDLKDFRIYVVVLVVVSSLLCGWGQSLIHLKPGGKPTPTSKTLRKFLPAFLGESKSFSSGYSKVKDETTNEITISSKASIDGDITMEEPRFDTNAEIETSNSSSDLNFWKALSDFAAHPNFRYWIGMEMLMEGQNSFLGNFQKTFVDQLLRNENGESTIEGGWSNNACDWMLALLDPCTQIVGLLLFLPIMRYGYALLYKVVFVTNIFMACALLLSNGLDNNSSDDNDKNGTLPLATFLFLSIVLSNAMAGAGFGLAMCDMVLEMKHSHSVTQGRTNPPSLAGLFMGVNALFCKPVESILPILAASFLGDDYNSDDNGGFGSQVDDDNNTSASAGAKVVLYRLLVLPPLVCSVLQLVVWSRYSLVAEKTEKLRAELKEHEQAQRQTQQQRRHGYRDGSFDDSDGNFIDADVHGVIEMSQLG